MTKLSESQIKRIKSLKPKPVSFTAKFISKEYGIHTSQVYRIWNGVCWSQARRKK